MISKKTQIVITIFISFIFTYICNYFNYRNLFNIIWMVFAPVLIAYLGGPKLSDRMIMSVGLMLLSLISSTLFMVVIWGGY